MNIKLAPGDVFYWLIRIYNEAEDDTLSARDCENETFIIIIKRTQSETADEIERLTITWTDQDNGIGVICLDHAMSKTFTGNYWWQGKLYNTSDNSVVKSSKIYKLVMESVLEKDLS